MDQLNLKGAMDLALGDLSDWGETEKAFVQALREKLNGYIQNNPEEFSPPLHFVFTGVDMTVSEANKERHRVAHFYEALEMEEQHFASSIQATVANVFLHVWPRDWHSPAASSLDALERQSRGVPAMAQSPISCTTSPPQGRASTRCRARRIPG